ncbi:HNH endonuclease domain protein [Geoanaerobacter pelophilus]|uniref:HNH endonuclease domain protein n=1 Tax=Geoanaerobacter pelophilus TaxID=60036 RepID=A0ABQ0MLK3_9BACT|nr:HNH endonuclease [Geoanaerobacter pelophilus]GAW67967.1 HNH endonuclease domain protein [Geoanaerobacter pelophilus]
MEYIKVYSTKVPNAAITLDKMIQLAPAFSKISNSDIRRHFSKLLDRERLNFWDFGVRATAALKNGDSVSIICGSKCYSCQIIDIIKDPNGELGDLLGWARQFGAPWKNVCALTVKSTKLLSPTEIKQLLSNSRQLASSFYHHSPSQPPRKPEALSEGRVVELSLTTFERNPAARKSCLDHFGPQCYVCEFDFEKTYGELGKGFIHVHHITPLSHIRESYAVDPIKDLIPVCPNCHAMLHIRQGEPLTVPELKAIYYSKKA